MKKHTKYISVILTAMLVSGCCSTAFYAATLDENTDSVKAIYEKEENGRTLFYDENNNEIAIEDLNADESANRNIPAKYDLRDYGRVTSVKNQGSEGYCWAFGSVASMESSILSQSKLRNSLGENPENNLDISEAGQSWFIHTGITDKSSPFYGDYIIDSSKGSQGGNPNIIAVSLNSGFGTYPEELCPYYLATKGFSDTIRYYSDYRLKEFNELSNDTDTLKSKIMSDGAITISYPSISYCYSDNSSNYYSDDSCFSNDQSHLISIVGWDDNYSKENFKGRVQPEKDGAWLCKNSWGENYGENGYIWISYYTSNIYFSQFIMQGNDAYDNEYQNCIVTNGFGYNYDGAANIFTAESDEQLKQISFKTIGAYDYTASVYALNTDFTSPKDGTLLTTFSGKINTNGIHCLDVNDDVYLTSDQKFSVVIESNNDSSYMSFSSAIIKNENCEENNCFVLSGGKWKDAYNQLKSARSYASIKAFTSNTDNSNKIEELKKAINDAESIDKDSFTRQDYEHMLYNQINTSKDLLNNSCSVQDMNNAIILINYYKERAIDAPFEINSLDDFLDLSGICNNSAYIPTKIELNTDLDFADYKEEIKPLCDSLGYFSSTFYGNGHKIKNIKLGVKNIASTSYSGLFGNLNKATVFNLTIENATVHIADECGVLSAKAEDSSIYNCIVKASTIDYNYFSDVQCSGALCGEAWNTFFTNCKSEGNTIYGKMAGEFTFSIMSKFKNCLQSDNKVYSTYAVSVFDDSTNSTKNLYFITNPNNSDILIEMQNNYLRASALIHTITAYNSENTKVNKTDNYYYIDKSTINNNDFVFFDFDNTDADNKYSYKVNLKDKSLILTSINFDPDNTLEIPSTYLGHNVTRLSEFFFSSIDPSPIKTLILPDSLTTLEDLHIKSLYNLENLVIGNGITEIPDIFSSNMYSLKNVSLGNKVERIGKKAFASCEHLTDINLPDSVKYIDDDAFKGDCFNKVTIGKNVEYIGNETFGYFYYILTNRGNKNILNPYFVINGYSSTAAEKYAKENGIKFVDLNTEPADIKQSYTKMSDLIKGDINLDGKVDINDVTLLQDFLAGYIELNDFQYYNAAVTDYTFNITVNNVTEIQKYLAGNIESLDINAAG